MRIIIVGVTLVCLALAACSGGDPPELFPQTPSLEIVPTVEEAVPEPDPSDSDEPDYSETRTTTPTPPASELEAPVPVANPIPTVSPDTEVEQLPEPEPRPEMNWQDFPNVSFLFQPFDILYSVSGGPTYTMPRPQLLERITYDTEHWQNLRREPLVNLEYFTTRFSDLFLGSRYRGSAQGGGNPMSYSIGFQASPDATTVFAMICEDCDMYSGPDVGRREFFQSNDGGLSWHHILTVPHDTGYWLSSGVVRQDEGYQLLLNFRERGSDDPWTHRLYPGGREVSAPEPPGGYVSPGPVVWNGQLHWSTSPISEEQEERLYLLEGAEEWQELSQEQRDAVVPGHLRTPPEGSTWPWPYGPPTYVDPETGETVSLLIPPTALPPDVHELERNSSGETFSGERWSFRALRHGPFLTVSFPKPPRYCESIRAAPDPDARELSCVVEGVLLSDLGEELEIDDQKWHQVQTPDGTVGWVLRGRNNLR